MTEKHEMELNMLWNLCICLALVSVIMVFWVVGLGREVKNLRREVKDLRQQIEDEAAVAEHLDMLDADMAGSREWDFAEAGS